MRSYQYQEPPPSMWPAPPQAPFPTSHSDQPNPLQTNHHPTINHPQTNFPTSHSVKPNPLQTNHHPTINHPQTNLQTSHSVPSSPRRLNLATLLPP